MSAELVEKGTGGIREKNPQQISKGSLEGFLKEPLIESQEGLLEIPLKSDME